MAAFFSISDVIKRFRVDLVVFFEIRFCFLRERTEELLLELGMLLDGIFFKDLGEFETVL